MTDYDSPWKDALERYFKEFMAFFFPIAHEHIDWDKGYTFLDKELQQVTRDAELGRRLVDKLVRVYDKDGKEKQVLIHIEVQGQAEHTFAERMFVYHYRLFDRYRKPIVSLAVLGDNNPKWRPDHFGYKYWGCEMGLRFPTVKLLDYRDKWQALAQHANPFAVMVQAHLNAQEIQKDDEGRYHAKLQLIKSLYARGYQKEDILEIFRFIDWVLQLPEELETQLWRELSAYEEAKKMSYITSVERIGMKKGKEEGIRQGLQQGLEQGVQQGLEQGVQQGLQQGQAAERQLLLRLIRRRFGVEVAESSAPLLEQIVEPSILEDLGELLLDCAEGQTWLQALSERVAGEK